MFARRVLQHCFQVTFVEKQTPRQLWTLLVGAITSAEFYFGRKISVFDDKNHHRTDTYHAICLQ